MLERRVLATLVLVAVLLPSAATARSGCAAPSEPASVAVSVGSTEVALSHSLTTNQLYTLARRNGSAHSLKGTVMGYTFGEVSARLKVTTRLVELRDGTFCGWPVQVMAEIDSVGPIIVHVAKELDRGSCGYRAILDHEKEHAAFFRWSLPDHGRRVQAALKHTTGGPFPITGSGQEEVRTAVEERFRTAFYKAVQAAASERDRRNARIDSPQSYKRIQARCRSW